MRPLPDADFDTDFDKNLRQSIPPHPVAAAASPPPESAVRRLGVKRLENVGNTFSSSFKDSKMSVSHFRKCRYHIFEYFHSKSDSDFELFWLSISLPDGPLAALPKMSNSPRLTDKTLYAWA